jgi:rod shape-determining protein MreD
LNKKITLAVLASLPMLLVTLLVLLFITPKHVAGLSGVMPLVQLVPVFIWGVMHPRDISLWMLSCLGLVVDVATGLPLGISAISYFLFFILIVTQRKYIYREGFTSMWVYFALLLLGMQAAAWGLVSFTSREVMPMGNAVMQWLFTVMCYPLLHFFLYPWVEKLSNARYRLLHA